MRLHAAYVTTAALLCAALATSAAAPHDNLAKGLRDSLEVPDLLAGQLPPQPGLVAVPNKRVAAKLTRFWNPFLAWFHGNLSSAGHLLTNLLHDGETGLTCDLCRVAIAIIRDYIEHDRKKEDVVEIARIICTEFKIETEDVCVGISNTFYDEIVHVLPKTKLSTEEICSTLMGPRCVKPQDPVDQWKIPIPGRKPPVRPLTPPPPGGPVLKVLHLSDVHYDHLYTAGAEANCREPLCCRNTSIKADGKSSAAAGKWGFPGACDTPLNTLENMMRHLSQEQFDYILWTGDLPPHDIWKQDRRSQLAVIQNVTDLILRYFPRTPVFPALGNHEGVPVNSFQPTSMSAAKDAPMSWLYDVLARNWGKWLPSQANQATIKFGAFFSALVKPGFRIISINTNYCNNLNWWLMLNMTDPDGELSWLTRQLEAAEAAGELVHVIGHIPPGVSDCLAGWSANYYRIIQRFESTVRAQFFGHTHKDSIELFYSTPAADGNESSASRPVGVAYVAPSVTPFPHLNPGYRVYMVDGDRANTSRLVVDHETYIANLTDANKPGSSPKWFLEYSAKAAYGMKSLLPTDWDVLVRSMTTNDTLWNAYYKFHYKSYPQTTQCGDACRRLMLCDALTARSFDTEPCKKLNVTARDLANHQRAKRAC